MEAFSSIDFILGAGVAMGAIAGFVRGLTRELARTICYAIAAAVAWIGCVPLGDILADKLNVVPGNRVLLAFILLFVGSHIVLWGARLLGRTMADFEFKGSWERFGGLLLGSLKNAAGLTLLLLYTAYAQPDLTHGTLIESSRFGTMVNDKLLPIYEKFAETHPEWYRPPEWNPKGTGEAAYDDQSRNKGRDPVTD